MKNCFIFKPCKADNSFKLVPQCEVDRKRLTENILKEMNGRIIADTSFLTIIEIMEGKVTITKKGEIIVRDVKEGDVEHLSSKLMRLI